MAIATVDIRDQTRREPFLMALATAGFAGYACSAGWAGLASAGSKSRLGATATLVLYLVAMAALFLLATAVYLVLEYAYVTGGFTSSDAGRASRSRRSSGDPRDGR